MSKPISYSNVLYFIDKTLNLLTPIFLYLWGFFSNEKAYKNKRSALGSGKETIIRDWRQERLFYRAKRRKKLEGRLGQTGEEGGARPAVQTGPHCHLCVSRLRTERGLVKEEKEDTVTLLDSKIYDDLSLVKISSSPAWSDCGQSCNQYFCLQSVKSCH